MELNGEYDEKEFEEWDCEGEEFDLEEKMLLDVKTAKRWNKKHSKPEVRGWTADEMFEMNKDKVVGKSTFDASLSQYSKLVY